MSIVLVVVYLDDDLTERKMLVVAGSTGLMLNLIHNTCHTGAGKDEHQRRA
ncbi:MAG: hypothetical protein J0H61_07300 [Alphaproteobacteria bacterium]|nr:hypothetical protein [Alphaproteobacteria bacterium]